MIRTTMKHEARLLAGDRTLALVVLLLLVLVVHAVANGASWTRFQQQTIDGAQQAEQDRFAVLEAELEAIAGGEEPVNSFQDPRLPAVVGARRGVRLAALPPAPLAALAVGQSDLLPYHHAVGTRTTEQALLANGEIDNPHNLHAGRFDLAFVLVYLLPLVILALSFDVLSGERERGTLALTLAQPVTLRRIVGAKVLTRAAVVLVLTVTATIGGALLAGVPVGRPGTSGLLLMWTAAVCAYAAFWFACAVLVNALGRSSAGNATALFGIWLAAVVIVPALISLAASLLHPVPSRVELVGAARAASEEATAERSRILAAYIEEHPELLPADAQPDAASFAAVAFATEQEVSRRVQPVLAHHDEQLAAQQRIVARYRYLSPAVLVHDALSDISGTGPARYQAFNRQVLEHADVMRAYFAPLLFRDERLAAGASAGIPAFRFEEEPMQHQLRRAGRSVLALALLALLAAAPALLLIQRQRFLT